MPEPLCRLSVQHGPDLVDLALPRETPVGLLLPSIVDLVHRGTAAAEEGRQWHLSRAGQQRLDDATSLHDNAIRDGELLLLTTTATPPPVWIEDDPWHTVINTADTGRVPTRVATTAASLCATALSAAALVWSGVVTHALGHVITAGAIAATAAAGAVATRRAHPDPIRMVTLSLTAVVFAAAAGFLAVPGDPSTAHSLLAAAVACTVSIVLLRVTRCAQLCLAALTTFTALTGAASACGVAWTLPMSTTGAALAVFSMATLALAARLSIIATGLAPGTEGLDPDPKASRAVAGHHTLTSLVIGSAVAAVLGVVLVVSNPGDRSWQASAVFAAVVGVVMALRARTHRDMGRRTALVVGGLAAIAAGVALVVISAPAQANWICLLIAAIGLSLMSGVFGVTVNPLARRAVDLLEYLALAAVIPLACWVAGLYGLIRGLSLP
jgi:type VII secretion integral membrane protein EccD